MSLRPEAPMADYEDAVNEGAYYAKDFTFVPYAHPEPPVLEDWWIEPVMAVSREMLPEDPHNDYQENDRKLSNPF